jgi:hypothetical protein
MTFVGGLTVGSGCAKAEGSQTIAQALDASLAKNI